MRPVNEDKGIQAHIDRLYAAAFDTYDLCEIPRYLTEKTYLGGERFSFKNHEFQLDIISDTSRIVYVQKCAQVGLTEIQLRYALGVARLIPYFSVIMTWPYSGDAANMIKTRMNPIIQGSPDLRESQDRDLDNVEIKGIGSSLIYARGTSGTTSALSVPADMLLHDEVDRSDPHVLAQYQSRIKHSLYKMVRAFGTPTINGYGIALLMETARRKRHMCKCNHCNHQFVPTYKDDVHIPGYDGQKRDINKYNLHKINWQQAALLCPKCFKEPSLQPEHREWVMENPNDNHEAIGYYVTPFSVPNVVSIPSLVQESTVYTSYREFENQALGLTSTDSEEQLTITDIQLSKTDLDLKTSDLHCMGVDLGYICHVVIGRLTTSGELILVHFERVAMENLEARRIALAKEFRVLVTVCDIQPYTDLILRMQKYEKNLLAGVYHDSKKAMVYEMERQEADLVKGRPAINLAKIHRNLNFDEVKALFKAGKVVWSNCEEGELFEKHCLDMKRKQIFDRHQELTYVWVKSDAGNDHYHHALGYLHVACRLSPTANPIISFGSGVPILSSFRVTHPMKPDDPRAKFMQSLRR